MKTQLGASMALTLALAACGSASASGQARVDTNEKDPFAVQGSSAWERADDGEDVPDTPKKKTPASSASASSPAAPAAASEPALLGARHDLYLGKGAPVPCKCLAVVAGGPNTAGFVWSGTRPTIDPSSQLIIALGSEDVPCDGATSGASYQGYERDGENVIVRVEPAKPGRPVTHGAIVPKPGANGKIFVQAGTGSPYGRGPGDAARCAITPAR